MTFKLVYTAILAFATLTGCAAAPLQAPRAHKVASQPVKAQMFDRFVGKMAVDYQTQLAILEITAKGLMTQFSDDAVSVFHKLDTEDTEQDEMLLFRGKIFLGKDGNLYLASMVQGSKVTRFYPVGTYDMAGRTGEAVEFKLDRSIKLEVRNRGMLPHGGQPFFAAVTEASPVPVSQAPALVRGQ
jgi:hypothetical protein